MRSGLRSHRPASCPQVEILAVRVAAAGPPADTQHQQLIGNQGNQDTGHIFCRLSRSENHVQKYNVQDTVAIWKTVLWPHLIGSG